MQVGNQDFAIDLVFFHRGLACLVAFELKVGKFEPEHIGKLNFYVEGLDRNAGWTVAGGPRNWTGPRCRRSKEVLSRGHA